jgi:hypothetical protein
MQSVVFDFCDPSLNLNLGYGPPLWFAHTRSKMKVCLGVLSVAVLIACWAVLNTRFHNARYSTASPAHVRSKTSYLATLAELSHTQSPRQTSAADPSLFTPPGAILLVVADDLGFDLGCYGARSIRTPRIDALANTSVRLTQFYAAASLCTPSRAALFTGRLPARTGLGGTVLFPPGHPVGWAQAVLGFSPGLLRDEITVADALNASGHWSTSYVGKW